LTQNRRPSIHFRQFLTNLFGGRFVVLPNADARQENNIASKNSL
jgi:hypothetical protein